MNTRMEKYDNNNNNQLSRSFRNAELYKTINKSELDSYEIKSNATVLGENKKNEIDVEQIKKILDTRYNEMSQRKSIRIEKEEVPIDKKEEATKEYNINSILEKAKSEKPVSYEEERIKKLRDTQFDILRNLNLEKEPEVEDKGEAKLLDLINTITINESKPKSSDEDALDILSDLKGDDNTVVLSGMKEEIKNIEAVKQEKNILTKPKIDDTFYTKNTGFDKKDFDDLGIETSMNIWIKIAIVIAILLFLVGIFFFMKSILNF